MSRSKQQGINIPGIILDELKTKDYTNDSRFNSSKKRNAPRQLGRKERRKQQRAEKKHKHKSPIDRELQTRSFHEKKNSNANSKGIKTAISNQSNRKSSKAKNTDIGLPFSSDDELSSGDFEEFDENDLNEEEWTQLKELEDSDDEKADIDSENSSEIGQSNESEESSIDDAEEDIMSPEETMQKLKDLKKMKEEKRSKKSTKSVTFAIEDGSESGEEDVGSEEVAYGTDNDEMTVEETMAALKAAKNKKKASRKKQEEEEEVVHYPMAPSDRAENERDEMDMQYYAKKLNLKGKSKKIHARDEFDAVGGLLDGLDFFEKFGEHDEDYGDLAISGKNKDKESHETEKAFSSDDELSSDDFDDFDENDLDEEEWKQLRELEGDDSYEDQASDYSSNEDEPKKRKQKENPYVAASRGDEAAYVPPSLRKKQLEEDSSDNVVKADIRKKVKSLLNKLSDSNITIIITQLDDLYNNYPRQYVTETISAQVLDIIGQKNKLLDGFIMNYAAIAYALFRLRGTEMGAQFIQTTVESFLTYYSQQLKTVEDLSTDEALQLPKQCSNIITLLAYSYNFGFISCKLIYDLIHQFVEIPNEATTELLLRIVSVSGQLIRGDDPSALKDISSELLNNVKTIKDPSPRLQFLLSTMADLRNNRLKPSIIASDFHPLKKVLANVLKSSSADPLQVSLDDIKNVDNKGKWWLVGASWRGNMETAFEQADDQKKSSKLDSKFTIKDDLLDDIPDWNVIARQQRMNTDIRRAIFISIMSAQDYMDAFTKLEKLNLKNKQTIEIPRILLHCLLTDGNDNGYNPYYSLIASKICEEHHQLLKSFQFLFWDIVKKFENDAGSDSEDDLEVDFDTDEDKRLKKIANQGRFFGHLLADDILKLDGFKHVPIMGGLSSDGLLFIEVLLYQLLLTVGKKAEKSTKKAGKKTYTYKNEIVQRILVNGLKLENRSVIMKGLKWFMTKKLKYKTYLVGNPGEKSYERDKRRVEWALSKFIEEIDETLGGMSF